MVNSLRNPSLISKRESPCRQYLNDRVNSPFTTKLLIYRKHNILAMRMGPGKHLKGLTLAEDVVKPEEVF